MIGSYNPGWHVDSSTTIQHKPERSLKIIESWEVALSYMHEVAVI